MGLILLRKRKQVWVICDNENIPWRVRTILAWLSSYCISCLSVCLFACFFFAFAAVVDFGVVVWLLLLFCWRFVVIALLSVLRLDYKIGHRKSFWYSPFLIQFFAHDYDSTTDETYSLRSRSIGINRFWLVGLFKFLRVLLIGGRPFSAA